MYTLVTLFTGCGDSTQGCAASKQKQDRGWSETEASSCRRQPNSPIASPLTCGASLAVVLRCLPGLSHWSLCPKAALASWYPQALKLKGEDISDGGTLQCCLAQLFQVTDAGMGAKVND